MECGDLSPLFIELLDVEGYDQVAKEQSADRSAHSKVNVRSFN
jgi:hypothetical protein